MIKDSRCLKYEIKGREQRQFPLNWPALFRREAPMAVEIGCGNGEFLVNWAASRPDWNFVGIEISLGSAARIQKRLQQAALTNVRVLRDDARFVLRELFPDGSVQHIMMNFPDPWPKERHRHRRVVIPPFIRTVAAVLAPDGRYELVTDQDWYAAEARQLFQESTLFRVAEIETNPARPVSTKYERKWREEGRQIYRLVAHKQRSAPITRIVESGDMPHYMIDQEITSRDIAALKGLTRQENGHLFVIKEIYFNQEQRTHLLRTVVSDDDYQQAFFILVSPHQKGFIVKIDPVFQPYRTPAVKMAVFEVGKQLAKTA